MGGVFGDEGARPRCGRCCWCRSSLTAPLGPLGGASSSGAGDLYPPAGGWFPVGGACGAGSAGDRSQSFMLGPLRWPLVPPRTTSSGSSGASSSPCAPAPVGQHLLAEGGALPELRLGLPGALGLEGRRGPLHQGLAPLHARGRVGRRAPRSASGRDGDQGVERGLVVGAHQAGHELLLGGHGVQLLAQLGRLVDVRLARLALLLLQGGALLGPGLLRLLLLRAGGPAVDLGLDAALLLLAGGGGAQGEGAVSGVSCGAEGVSAADSEAGAGFSAGAGVPGRKKRWSQLPSVFGGASWGPPGARRAASAGGCRGSGVAGVGGRGGRGAARGRSQRAAALWNRRAAAEAAPPAVSLAAVTPAAIRCHLGQSLTNGNE